RGAPHRPGGAAAAGGAARVFFCLPRRAPRPRRPPPPPPRRRHVAAGLPVGLWATVGGRADAGPAPRGVAGARRRGRVRRVSGAAHGECLSVSGTRGRYCSVSLLVASLLIWHYLEYARTLMMG